jgi:hypothetical protein
VSTFHREAEAEQAINTALAAHAADVKNLVNGSGVQHGPSCARERSESVILDSNGNGNLTIVAAFPTP